MMFVATPEAGVPSAGAMSACPLGRVTVHVNVGEARFAFNARSVLSAIVPSLSWKV